ncbi:MAG: hypothetical protein KBS60_01830, partial [Phascolarctobacterium sp.]|nr:hypothetical protein [Candidatus Phascolarctobacterium caballi]
VYLTEGSASGNKATMTNGTIPFSDSSLSTFGAVKMVSGTAESNEVEVSASECAFIVGVYVDGGSDDTEVNKNKVTVSGSTGKSVIVANLKDGNAKGKAAGNILEISDSVYEKVAGADISEGNAEENTITITKSSSSTVCGGATQKGSANENVVNIESGSISGAQINVVGGYVESTGNADYNVVNINNGEIKISGSGVLAGGVGIGGNAVGNQVNIKGGNFTGGEDFTIAAGLATGAASNNILTISGGDFAAGISYYGGMGSTGGSANVLNLVKTVIAGEAKDVNYFQKMNFTIPSGATTDTVMIKSQTAVALHDSNGDIAFTTNLNKLSLKDGEYITLIKNVKTDGLSDSKWDADTEMYKWDDVDGYKYQILDFGGTKELVYGKGDINAKADFDIITGGVTSKVGDCYYNDGGGTTDDIANTAKTYNYNVLGNTDVTDGTPTTSYSNNQVIVRRGTYKGTGEIKGIFGALAVDGSGKVSVDGNKVEIIDGTVQGTDSDDSFIVGGCNAQFEEDGDLGTASNNQVIIHSIKLVDNVNIAGGYLVTDYDGEGTVAGNSVVVENLSDGHPMVYGGYNMGMGETILNSVEICTGTYYGVLGGVANGGSAVDNKVVIHNGIYNDGVEAMPAVGGGLSGIIAIYNEVLIENGTFNGDIFGGFAFDGAANENKVTIKDGTFEEGVNIYGGNSVIKGNAEKNSVTLEAGSFEDEVSIYGGYTEKGNVKNNVVTINNATCSDYAYVHGGCTHGNGNAEQNTVTINGGDYDRISVYGAKVDVDNTENINQSLVVNKNTINIVDGNFG